MTTHCIDATRFAASLFEGVVRRHPEDGARCGVLRRRLVTAAPGGRDPARQALRPGCEELAVTDPDAGRSLGGCSVREARPRAAQNRHGGAPRGERPALWDAWRLASAWRAASWHAKRVFRRAPKRLSALRPPLVGVSGRRRQGSGGHGHLPAEASAKAGEAKRQSPGAKARRGKEMGCLTW